MYIVCTLLESRLEQFGVIYYTPLNQRSDRNRSSLDISPYWKILIQGVELLQGYAEWRDYVAFYLSYILAIR